MNINTLQKNNIFTIEINRPESLNTLNGQTLQEINEAISHAEENSEIQVIIIIIIIIIESSEKYFVARADIKEFSDYNAAQAEEMSRKRHLNVFDKIENLKKTVIAAINGFTLIDGLELAMACHIRYASETARLGLPSVTLGLIPRYGGTQGLPKLVGKGLANEIIFSAKMIPAQKAKEIGLVNDVFPLTELINKTKELASTIAKNSPFAITEAVASVNASYSENGFEKEIQSFGKLFKLQDKRQGVTRLSRRENQTSNGK